MKFTTLEDIAAELHITPGTARNRLMRGQDRPPSIKVVRRWLFPVTEFKQWVESVVVPLQEAPRKDALLLSKKHGRLRRSDKLDSRP
ncbi:MAG: DNA-binding protein [Acidiferrobacterales bacterium]